MARSEPSVPGAANSHISAPAWVHLARGLHARLIDPESPPAEKLRLAREVEGALFAAESQIRVSNRARILFFRLRTHAHLAAARGINGLRNNATTWMDYDELELLVEHAVAGEKSP